MRLFGTEGDRFMMKGRVKSRSIKFLSWKIQKGGVLEIYEKYTLSLFFMTALLRDSHFFYPSL